LRADTDAQRVGLLGIGPGTLVHAQGTTAMAEGIAADLRAGVAGRVGQGVQALFDLVVGTGAWADCEGAGVGLLLLVAGSLVDRH
ncbi:hypothetical protein NL393_36365, partial [Klebsiella pneumoniae]|nr:hypothetical protein [Klebsiella pneumoniae]